MNRKNRTNKILSLLEKRVVVIDGAMGTALQAVNLTFQDFGGEELEGCNEALIIHSPNIIKNVHRDYIKAGADIIETNTFGANPIVLEEYGLGEHTQEINKKAVEIAFQACDEFQDRDIFVAGSIGPTTKSLSVTGGATFEELEESFYIQALALYEGGVDYFLLETCQDTLNIKAALNAIDRVFEEKQDKIPVAVSITVEANGAMLAGQRVIPLLISLEHREFLYIGLNCAMGPNEMEDYVTELALNYSGRVACVPNAGLPQEDGLYLETPEMLKRSLKNFIETKGVTIVGGCCGTTPKHIQKLADLKNISVSVKHVPQNMQSKLSGINALILEDEPRPILIGERTNVIGSRKFKQMITEKKFNQAAEIALGQINAGAKVIDVCLANPDSDELDDMKSFMAALSKKIKTPVMIDSTSKEVIEAGLRYSQGKAIINSTNLEDGQEKLISVAKLAVKYGAALVVGTIDEEGMAIDCDKKITIAKRAYQLLVNTVGLNPKDIYWDLLVFPVGTGELNYIDGAKETVKAISKIKKIFPETKTLLGISNVSFGLSIKGRAILNSIFTHYLKNEGLDFAIVNAQKIIAFEEIDQKERKLSENILFNNSKQNLQSFIDHFKNKVVVPSKKEIRNLPLNERLKNAIVEGVCGNLENDLKESLDNNDIPFDIINGPLMDGMNRVGELFNNNQLIISEVLQSAEAMRYAVKYLESHMDKKASMVKGKILLATVKGDVHDIGKNLLDIVLSNNGFEVIDIGIKVDSESIISAIKKYRPDILGLSGLLVKSAYQMQKTVSQIEEAGLKLPILLGGAALTKKFVSEKICKQTNLKVYYAKDVMHGLQLANEIVVKK